MLRLIQFALRKPVTIIVLVFGMMLFSILAIRKSAIDIFPAVNAPTIYVAQTYGGLSPQQMEGFITSYYEYHFLYITGIKAVESKSIQGLSLIKLQFHEGTNMAAAMAEVVSYATRARSFMPPGTLPPFIMRYDAGSVPVGQLVFSSSTRSLNEIQDLALFKVRPMFASLSGVSAPPPFGGNQRTIVVKADPDRLRSYNITADELVTAIAKNNPILPVSTLDITQGQYVAEGGMIMQLENYEQLWVEADLYPNEASLIKPGENVQVIIPGFEQEPQQVKINFTQPALPAGTQLLQVRGTIENKGGRWQPGMQALVIAPRSSGKKDMVLPVDAVIRNGQTNHVWVAVNDGQFEPREVTLGAENADRVEITDGLKPGDKVVVSGAYLLHSEFILKKGSSPEMHHH